MSYDSGRTLVRRTSVRFVMGQGLEDVTRVTEKILDKRNLVCYTCHCTGEIPQQKGQHESNIH